jgi:hypothetical protein
MFITRVLSFAIIDSFLHFRTAPDNTSSSEREGIPTDAHG